MALVGFVDENNKVTLSCKGEGMILTV